MRPVTLLLSMLLITAAGLAQTPVPPPPKPPDSGPSLEVTMKFIADKLGEQGKLNYVAYYHDSATSKDWAWQYSYEYINIVADLATCRVGYHWRQMAADGKLLGEGDLGLSLAEVRDFAVLPYEQHMQRANADGGHPTWSCTATPPVFVLKGRLLKGNWGVVLKEEEMANRLAKAMVHAVELCGGGAKPEPF